MNMTRRDLAAAGALALGDDKPRRAASAAEDEAAIGQSVEELRKAILAQDKAKLEA